ncbi:hypothetical protein [Sideroxydans sp. CL21]|nr:hypothetical protein [Sideroxydans sp. CL21]
MPLASRHAEIQSEALIFLRQFKFSITPGECKNSQPFFTLLLMAPPLP